MIVIYEKYLRVHVCIGAAINYFELNWKGSSHRYVIGNNVTDYEE